MDFQINDLLSVIKINIDQILLDPNNPRFSELGEAVANIPEQRFNEPKVQQLATEKMRNPDFGVAELRDTIRTVGFLPMDRIVVRPWTGRGQNGEELYVVVEGNRRVTALKWLLELNSEAKITLEEFEVENFSNLECLLLDSEHADEVVKIILPGLRHVSGIKEWKPYQKAKTIFVLRNSGMSPQDAAQSIGLSTRAANQAYRCFLALEQMKAHEEFTEQAQPNLYSYFEEVFKKNVVKQWLGWSDEKEQFTNEENLEEFYSWIVPDEDGNPAKIDAALDIRDLAKIIDNVDAFSIFRAENGSLQNALVQIATENPADWHPKVVAAATAIKNLPAAALIELDDNSVELLRNLAERIKEALHYRELLANVQADDL